MFYFGRFSGDGPVMVLLKCCILQQIGSEKDQVKFVNFAKFVISIFSYFIMST